MTPEAEASGYPFFAVPRKVPRGFSLGFLAAQTPVPRGFSLGSHKGDREFGALAPEGCFYFAAKAPSRKTPILPLLPTTNGRLSAFHPLSASTASAGPGRNARQFFPSSTETSVPFGPTVIHALIQIVVRNSAAIAVRRGDSMQ